MKRDFSSCMLYAVFGLPIFLLLFIGVLYVANCGFSADCSQASLPGILHTPIPTMVPATIPSEAGLEENLGIGECRISTRDLLATWVGEGYSETQSFDFRDISGNVCKGTFADVIPLFTQPSLWYQGALACDACHNSDLSKAAARLDLSSYAGIIAGGKRTPPSGHGEDILGGGNWEQSILNEMLFVNQLMPFGHPIGADMPDGPVLQAGRLASELVVVPTPTSSGSDVARPSNPGGTGEAIQLTGDATAGEKVYLDRCQVCHGVDGKDDVLNPGSDDGTIPALNPIDSTLVSTDYQTYAYNLDLFLQNGSVPPGVNPAFRMPAWGVRGALTQQQIADVIAYIISLNQ